MTQKPTAKVYGISDKRKLLGFFAKKGHHNLVLRTVDVLELHQSQLLWLLSIVVMVRDKPIEVVDVEDGQFSRDQVKRYLLREYPGGFIALPFSQTLERMSIDEAEMLQEIIGSYKNIRMGKGEPCRIAACDKCNGTRRRAGKKCAQCDGSGTVTTFMEMFDEERTLAELEVT